MKLHQAIYAHTYATLRIKVSHNTYTELRAAGLSNSSSKSTLWSLRANKKQHVSIGLTTNGIKAMSNITYKKCGFLIRRSI
jgi:hypothetical protein